VVENMQIVQEFLLDLVYKSYCLHTGCFAVVTYRYITFMLNTAVKGSFIAGE